MGYFTAVLAGAICLGGLFYIVTTARPDSNGIIDPPAYRIHLVLERVSLVWLVASALMVVVQAATDAGAPALRLLESGRLAEPSPHRRCPAAGSPPPSARRWWR